MVYDTCYMQTNYIIYTDGGARGNPGPAGAGALVMDSEGNVLAEIAEPLGVRTNNWAEYEAVYLGLTALKNKVGKARAKEVHVEVRTDSELIVRQLRGEYQIKEPTLFPQFMKIWNMRVADMPHVRFTHVRREQNKEADRLSNVAMDRNTL